ncbi:angiopoietin-2-like [Drosophila gunungcola]|uniref:Fibrinogen C-terminal domain-containing protein n=1 Tax=Drosophila gunungcola TaxID=103775 RepID=A0A9Q0BJ46_9MUSC|nr:angiopoietin-2-like [Drosophila gunungcola]KAI8033319.1 hypothetical protein M5D96_013923 [Drosophila gunungcola]
MRSEFLIIFLSTLVLKEVSSSHPNNECTPVLKDNYKLGVEVKSMNATINKLLIEKRLGDVQIEIKDININKQSATILEQNKTIEKHKERLKDITNIIQFWDSQIKQKDKEIEDQKVLFQNIIDKVTDLQSQLDTAKGEIERNEESLDSKNIEILDKTENIEVLQKEIDDLRNSKNEEIEKKNENIQVLLQIKQNQTELLQDKDYQIGKMTKTIEDLNENLGIANGKIKNLTEKGETLTKSLENLKKNKEIVDSKYKELVNHSERSDKTIKAKDAQISELNKNLGVREGIITKNITDMQSSLDSANNNIKKKVDLINAQNNEIIQIKRNQTELLQEKDYQIGKMTKTIEDLNDNIDIKNEENKNLTQEVKTLTEDLVDLWSMLQTAKYDLESKDKQIADLEKRESSAWGQMVAVTNELRECNRAETCPRWGLYGTHKLKLRGIDTFEVPCNASGWMTIQRRYDGSVNFNRNWTDYKYGFGPIAGEFFIGLEKLHVLTAAQRYELSVKLGNTTTGRIGYAHYEHFQIGSEKELYELKSLGKFSGSVEDRLRDSVKQKFSTYDQFNSRYIKNCASDGNGGWWYDDCCECSLNGKYHKDGYVEIMIRTV